MPLVLPLAVLLIQALLMGLMPADIPTIAYLAMVIVPALSGVCVLVRARREATHARSGWLLLACAVFIWTGGAGANLWHEWVLGRQNDMYREAMLAFHLSAVPLLLLIATPWRAGWSEPIRWVDAGLSLALGVSYFLLTWQSLTARGAPDEASVAVMVWLVDAQNLFVAAGAVVRWRAAQERAERDLFTAVATHSVVYMVLAGLNNHWVAEHGPEISSAITVAFALLMTLALRPAGPMMLSQVPLRVVLMVRSLSPVMIAGALLGVSLVLVPFDYPAGVVGVLVAVLGYALRNTLSQASTLANGELLRREHDALQSVAFTDALTGVANRHWLDRSLNEAWRRALRERHSMSVLMIDIDHFKLLNDRYGHTTGDHCLREVAEALSSALVRPGDHLVRYGGEEFLAILEDADADGAVVVAERMRHAVATLRLEHMDSASGLLSVSIGVASAMAMSGRAPITLVEAADKALYDAKCQGRDRVIVAADAGSADTKQAWATQ